MGIIDKIAWGTTLTGVLITASSCAYSVIDRSNSPYEMQVSSTTLYGLGGLTLTSIGLICAGAIQDRRSRKYSQYVRDHDNLS